MANISIDQPAIASTCSGQGLLPAARLTVEYYLPGDANALRVLTRVKLNQPVVVIVPTCGGYYLLGAADGGVF